MPPDLVPDNNLKGCGHRVVAEPVKPAKPSVLLSLLVLLLLLLPGGQVHQALACTLYSLACAQVLPFREACPAAAAAALWG
jgi:hypothetical protein